MNQELINYASDLYSRFCMIFGDKFVKAYHNESFVNGWINEWAESLNGIDIKYIKSGIEHCKNKLEWPPSIAEFIGICDKLSGFPTYESTLQAAIRKEFTHPIIKLTYDSVGSWSMSHDNEDILYKKFKIAYDDAVTTFRLNRMRGLPQIEPYVPENLIELKR